MNAEKLENAVSNPRGPTGGLPILIITVGLPLSGKTSWARALGFPIVSPDAVRMGLHDHVFIEAAEPFVWAITKTMVRSLFIAGHNVVVFDSTNTLRQQRMEWISPEWFLAYHEIDTSKEEALKRAELLGRDDLLPAIEKVAECQEPINQVDLNVGKRLKDLWGEVLEFEKSQKLAGIR